MTKCVIFLLGQQMIILSMFFRLQTIQDLIIFSGVNFETFLDLVL